MTVETATYIDDLNSSYPAGSDQKLEGDNHIRLLKAVLLATFPNIAGIVSASHTELSLLNGLTATSTELNLLHGITALSSTDDVIDNFPSGTLMTFQQTSAPTGWTKSTTHNDKAFRVVSGTASSGGSAAFSSVFGLLKATSSHVLTAGEIPAHYHAVANGDTATQTASDYNYLAGAGSYGGSASNYTLSSTNTTPTRFRTGNAGTGGGHTHQLSLDVQYVDLIIAAKD